MPSFRELSLALLTTALLALSGCGGGGGVAVLGGDSAPAGVQLDTASTATATLGPAGGSVVATAADGRRYTLTVPEGALAADTEITATPVLSMGDAPLAGGLRGAVRFGPAGLRFAEPARLRIEGANTDTSPGQRLVGFVRSQDGASMQLLATALSGGAIEAEVHHFSDVGVSQADAQAVAQVPVDANARPDEALLDAFLRGFEDTTDQAGEVALLVRLHDTLVEPRLVVAELRLVATDTEREMAILVARQWLSAIEMTFPSDEDGLDPDALPGSLGPLVTTVRQRVLGILTEDFEAGRTACMEPAPIGTAQLVGLQNSLRARAQVRLFRDLGGLPGLDADTVGRRLNDCVRVVFEPRELPAFTVGRPVSLDLRAQLVFAADPNASIQVPFDFNVISFEVNEGGADGFSDAQGNFTAVVTPIEANPRFDVQACMVTNLRDGGPVSSALCGNVNLGGGPAPVVFAGEVRFFTFSVFPTEPRQQLGSVRLRLQAEPDGSFTVLEALGSIRRTIAGTTSCAPFPADGTPRRDVFTSSTVDATITGGRQNDFLNAGRFIGFTLTGQTISVTQTLNLDCSVATTTTTSTNAGSFQILQIERDAQGIPLAIVVGDSQNTQEGRLEPE